MKKVILFSCLLMLLGFVSGCTGDDETTNQHESLTCTINDDCSTGMRCIMDYAGPDFEVRGGSCVADGDSACNTNADCSEGFSCQALWCEIRSDGQELCYGNVCVPDQNDINCDADTDCPQGMECTPVYCALNEDGTTDPIPCLGGGICTPRPEGECQIDEDCPDGFGCEYTGLCDPNSEEKCIMGGFCVPQSQNCTTNEECDEGFYCELTYACELCDCEGQEDCECYCGGGGICRQIEENDCITDEDCPDGFGCEYMGLCPVCADDSTEPCLPCVEGGFCVPQTNNCTVNEDCPNGYRCSTDDVRCSITSDGTERCFGGEGYCIPMEEECGADYPCPEGFVCQMVDDCGYDCADTNEECVINIEMPCIVSPQCVPEAQRECSDTNPCPEGFDCETYEGCWCDDTGECGCSVSGVCVPQTTGECEINEDCPEGFACEYMGWCEVCDSEDYDCVAMPCVEGGFCVPVEQNCENNEECGDGFYCELTYDCPVCDCLEDDFDCVCPDVYCVGGGVCRPNPETDCYIDEDCGEGFQCVFMGWCQECLEGEDCLPCVEGGFCVPAEQNCENNEECGDGFYCELNYDCIPCDCADDDIYCVCAQTDCIGGGVCRPNPETDCRTDADCMEGFRCEQIQSCPVCDLEDDCIEMPCVTGGFCVPAEQNCENNEECGDGFYCELNYDCFACECPEDNPDCICARADCIGGGVCRPLAEPECKLDADCPEGFQCVYMGLCDPNSTEPCVVGGFCSPINNQCQINEDCDDGDSNTTDTCIIEYNCPIPDDPDYSESTCGMSGYCVHDDTDPINQCIEACGVGCPAPEYWLCGSDGNFYCNDCIMACYGAERAEEQNICLSSR